ncbi:hypothetical protein U5B43_09875 [Campylobacter sp. 9BO]|uniref:hypothetical protein n=1 Tax=Campylobacter sp. 9BO TaxID=3424759 RepID=UPI003D32E93C
MTALEIELLNELESLENEQKQIETTKTELNQLLESGKNDYSIADYQTLAKQYESLQNDYNLLESELSMIKQHSKRAWWIWKQRFKKHTAV